MLYEGHYDHYMDAVAVVYTTPETQLQRLMKRNQLTLEQAQQRISSQLPIEEKAACGYFVRQQWNKRNTCGTNRKLAFANRFL